MCFLGEILMASGAVECPFYHELPATNSWPGMISSDRSFQLFYDQLGKVLFD